MVPRRQTESSAKDKKPGIANGLIDLVCVLARHAARELVASSTASTVHDECPDDRAQD